MLTRGQLEDLALLHMVAEEFAAEVAIIGAAALLCFLELGRFTRDLDLAVALDLEDFAVFSAQLSERGWTREPRTEHRWRGPGGSLMDLIPAGPNLRAARRTVWPESRFAMSLVGFHHVFARALPFPFAPGVQYRVAPPSVIALLKTVSYMDDPHGRQKDLTDLRTLFRRYEEASERIFGDDVFAAELEDIEYANALLLGMDVGALATDEEVEIVKAFLGDQIVSAEELLELERDDVQQREALRFQQQLRAFRKGLERSRNLGTR